MARGKIKYAPIYFDNRKQLAMLSDEERGKLLLAILDYAMSASEGEPFELSQEYGLSQIGEVVYWYMVSGIDRCYETSMARAIAGANGGKASRSKVKQNEANLSKVKQNEANGSKTKQSRYDKDKDKDNDKDNDNDKDYDNDYVLGAEQCSLPVITLPLNTGEGYEVTDSLVDEWESLYPAVDVMQELRNMKGWLMANPKNRKTRTGVKRFCAAWLARAQNSARRVPDQGKSFMDIADEIGEIE